MRGGDKAGCRVKQSAYSISKCFKLNMVRGEFISATKMLHYLSMFELVYSSISSKHTVKLINKLINYSRELFNVPDLKIKAFQYSNDRQIFLPNECNEHFEINLDRVLD